MPKKKITTAGTNITTYKYNVVGESYGVIIFSLAVDDIL